MPDKFDRINSRYEQRAKRRKTNIILNTLIAIVLILILIVGGSIFLTDSKTEKEMKEAAKTEAQTAEKQQSSDKQDTTDEKEETDEESDEQEVVEKESDEQNVEKVIIDPEWEPVGTEQTGHQSSYQMGSIDWNEKEKAAAYAIGISPENMTNWWTKGGANPDSQAIMTVSESSKPNEAYRVYLEWVDGEGWKPTEVKKLIENDKGQE